MKKHYNPLIFVVDDDLFYLNLILTNLKTNNFTKLHSFLSGEECEKQLNLKPDIVFLDYQLGSTTGLDVLKKIKNASPNTHVVLLSGQDKIEVAVDSMKYGAFDYVIKNETAFERIVEVLEKIHKFTIAQNKKRRKKLTIRIVKWSLIGIFVAAFIVVGYITDFFTLMRMLWKIWVS